MTNEVGLEQQLPCIVVGLRNDYRTGGAHDSARGCAKTASLRVAVTKRSSRLVLFGSGLAALAAIVLQVWAMAAAPSLSSDFLAELRQALTLVLVVAYAVIGLVIIGRAATTIGTLLVVVGLDRALVAASGIYERYAAVYGLSLGPQAGAVNDWAWAAGITLGGLALQLFPNGRPLGRAWRYLAWLTVAWPFILEIDLVLSPVSLHGGQPVPNQFGGGLPPPFGQIFTALVPWILFLYVCLIVLSAATLVVRYRRARGIERQQLKWIASAAGLVVLALLADISFVSPAWQNVVASGAEVAVPLSIAIAILRYRLFDIDVLVRRTFVYGATSAAIALTFFAGIVALQTLLRPLTSGSELAVAASTLVSFALFQPVRRRVQNGVDRRFDRSRYDAARTLDAFADGLRDEVDLDALRADLLSAVNRTMSPAHASVWLRGEHR